MMTLEGKVKERLEALIDPETGLAFREMGLIKELKEEKPGVIRIEFRPTSPFCPIALRLANDIKNTAMEVDGVTKALVYCRNHKMGEDINRIINENEASWKLKTQNLR